MLHRYSCEWPSVRALNTAAAWQEHWLRVTCCLTWLIQTPLAAPRQALLPDSSHCSLLQRSLADPTQASGGWTLHRTLASSLCSRAAGKVQPSGAQSIKTHPRELAHKVLYVAVIRTRGLQDELLETQLRWHRRTYLLLGHDVCKECESSRACSPWRQLLATCSCLQFQL